MRRQPAVRSDTFIGDVINMLAFRPVYRTQRKDSTTVTSIKVTRTVHRIMQETTRINLPGYMVPDSMTVREFDDLVDELIDDQLPEIDEDYVELTNVEPWRITA